MANAEHDSRIHVSRVAPLYIFDLDGTLALIDHRRHLVTGPKKDWRAFFAACVDDQPNAPVIQTFYALRESSCRVMIWSARSDEVRQETEAWLAKHGLPTDVLRMRAAGDFTSDAVLKLYWLNTLPPDDRSSLTAVFDDRDDVVKMWRANGVACFQVAQGAF